MAACPTIPELEAFFDGELDAARSAEIRAHLLTCLTCAAELSGIEATANLFRHAHPQKLSQIALHRIHANLETVMRAERDADQGILRIARVLSAVAACIVVAGSLWLTQMRGTTTAAPKQTAHVQAPPPWTDVALNVDADAQAPAQAAQQDGGITIAEYYLADASQRGEEQQ